MQKAKSWIARHLPSRRRIVQLYAALLYNAHLRGFVEGEIYTGASKYLCVPGLNCYSCPGAVGACPLGALQNALASSSHRLPFYVLGMLMLFGLALGRMICGFLCPMGLIQDLLHRIPTPKIRKSRVTRVLSLFKYAVLAVLVVWIPLAYASISLPVPAFCKYICPAGTLEGAVGLLANPGNSALFSLLGALFTWKFVILILILLLSVFLYRFFCRFLCPLGALYGLFSRVALLGIRLDRVKCTSCGLCVAKCKMDIRRVGDRECISCGDCAGVCPVRAISWKGGRFFLGEERIKPEAGVYRAQRIAAWCAAALALAGMLWYFNRPAPNTDQTAQGFEISATQQPGTAAPVGSGVGMTCPDFSVPIYGGGSFSPSDARGHVVVINFWATWCTPCCLEMPYFDEIAREYPDVRVIAIHSSLAPDDVEAYLSGFSYGIPFALDETGDVIASLGGGTMLPMTVILDEDGVIRYNAVGSLTKDELRSLIDGILSPD